MYQFRIDHSTFPSTKFLLWIFLVVILQSAMTSVLNILELHKMKPWQWKSHLNSSGFVKKQMDSFVPFLCHSNCSQTCHLALQLCMPRRQLVSLPDVHYRLENFRCQYTFTNYTKCLDLNNSTFCSNHHTYPHLPGRNNTVH